MTATIQPPRREANTRPRHIRFSSLESLGFSDASATWSDNPVYAEVTPRGRHERVPPSLPVALADWEPQEFGNRLEGRNFRWSILITTLLAIAGLAAGGYWIYQQPNIQATSAARSARAAAEALDSALDDLEVIGASLGSADSSKLFDVDRAARALFDISGELPDNESATRSATAGAASAALDGVRLAGETDAYLAAVSPLITGPVLETDPNLIGLDEAARSFGEWQLGFDQVRTALPDGVLSRVTEQIDVLSADLGGFLSDYVDSLRQDDEAAVRAVIEDLRSRLGEIEKGLGTALVDIQSRISGRVAEARSSLTAVLGP